MSAIPSSLSLSSIINGTLADATPIQNNYQSIQAAVNALITALSGGASGQVLQAVDGTDVQWATTGFLGHGRQASDKSTAAITFGTGVDLLSSAITFTADGTSSYLVRMNGVRAYNSVQLDSFAIALNLDGSAGDLLTNPTIQGAGVNFAVPVSGAALITPSAGSHTVNARLYTGGGTVIVSAPTVVTVEKVG